MDIGPICDCHLHVFEDGRPLAPTATFRPPHAPVEAYQQVQRETGMVRALVVQPTGYGFDNGCTLDAMRRLGPDARGIAVVRADLPEAELQALHAAGMRGVRFMMLPGGVLPWDALVPTAARIAPLGWTINLQLDGHQLAEREAQLGSLPCRLVIDHLGKFLSPVTPDSPGFQALRRLLQGGNTWIKLSAPYESSRSGPPAYQDVQWIAETLSIEFPDRCLWASNWPHPNVNPQPSCVDMLAWFQARVPDAGTQRKILVDNPAELYGF